MAVPPSWPCVSVSEPKPRSEPSFMSNSACSHPALRLATVPLQTPPPHRGCGEATEVEPRRRLPHLVRGKVRVRVRVRVRVKVRVRVPEEPVTLDR